MSYSRLVFAGLLAGSVSMTAAAEVNVEAAELLFKQNECGKCHNATKTKKGPSLQKIAKEYKADKEAITKLTGHMTKGAKVKLDDGTEEDHKIINTKDENAKKNLAEWILAR